MGLAGLRSSRELAPRPVPCIDGLRLVSMSQRTAAPAFPAEVGVKKDPEARHAGRGHVGTEGMS